MMMMTTVIDKERRFSKKLLKPYFYNRFKVMRESKGVSSPLFGAPCNILYG